MPLQKGLEMAKNGIFSSGNADIDLYCPFDSFCATRPQQIEIKLIAFTVLEIAFLA